jgi:predicted DNA binding CopG/RHH family protein
MKKDLKNIPKLADEDKEREFWENEDSTEYINWDDAEIISFPKLKPSTRTISLRLPEALLNQIRQIANKQDVPYQSFIKMILKERIDREFKRSA